MLPEALVTQTIDEALPSDRFLDITDAYARGFVLLKNQVLENGFAL